MNKKKITPKLTHCVLQQICISFVAYYAKAYSR